MNQANQNQAQSTPLQKRFSILEALMTLFVTAVVFLASVPSNSLYAELGESYASLLSILTFVLCAFAAVFFAYLLYFSSTKLVLLAIPFTFFLSYFVTDSFYTAFAALIVFMAGIGIYLGLRKGNERSLIIIKASAFLGAWLFIYFAISVFYLQGEISISAIKEFFDTMRELLTQQLWATASGIEGYTKDIVNIYVNFTMIIIPGLFISICNIASYLLLKLFEKAADLFGRSSELPPQAKVFSMSLTSAIVYIVSAFIVTFISMFSEHYSIFALLVINFTIILMPGHFLIGIRSLKYQIKNPFTKKSAWTWIIITGFVALIFGFAYIFLFVALYGAWETISFSIMKKAFDKLRNNGDSNN